MVSDPITSTSSRFGSAESSECAITNENTYPEQAALRSNANARPSPIRPCTIAAVDGKLWSGVLVPRMTAPTLARFSGQSAYSFSTAMHAMSEVDTSSAA